MPVARFQMPDGRVARFEVPDGTTPAQAQELISSHLTKTDNFGSMDSVGSGQAFLIGAGRSTDKLIQGVKQLFGKSDAQREKSNDEVYSRLQQEYPIATGLGEALPSVAVPSSIGVLPAAAAIGSMDALKYGTAQERAARGAVGAGSAAAAGLVAKGISKAISPVADDALSQSQRTAMAGIQEAGVKPRLSQVTGSPLAARLEDYASRVPGGAGVMQDFAQANQKAINTSAASSIGQSANELTPQVFADANKALGSVFNEIRTLPGKPIKLDQGVEIAADRVLATQAKLPPEMRDSLLSSLANRAKSMAQMKGKIDGEAYQLIRSNLSDSAVGAFTGGNSTAGKAYQGMLAALDDAAQNSLSSIGKTDLAKSLKEVRPMYANFKMLEKGAVAEAGNVSPARLASAMRTNNPAAFREGRNAGELTKIARYGEAFKGLQQGSQTMEREAVSNPLSIASNALWSYPLARFTTSPLITGYVQNVGDTAAARGLSQVAMPAARGALLPFAQNPFSFMLNQ